MVMSIDGDFYSAGPKKRQRAEVKQEPEEDAGGSDDSGSEPEEASLSDSDAPDTVPSGVGSDAESEPGKKAKPRKAGRKQQAAASRTTPRRLAKVRSGAAPSEYPVFMCELLSDPSQHSYRAISYA